VSKRGLAWQTIEKEPKGKEWTAKCEAEGGALVQKPRGEGRGGGRGGGGAGGEEEDNSPRRCPIQENPKPCGNRLEIEPRALAANPGRPKRPLLESSGGKASSPAMKPSMSEAPEPVRSRTYQGLQPAAPVENPSLKPSPDSTLERSIRWGTQNFYGLLCAQRALAITAGLYSVEGRT
jgi:hypothetical protein